VEVSIRKFSHLDGVEFHEAVVESVEHLSYWLPWCTPDYALKDAEDWCSSASTVWEAGTDYRFLIEHQVSKEILGAVGFNQIVKNHRIGNLGYWVQKSALNKGVCSRASRLAIERAFSELNLHRVEIHVHPENHASNAVASKLGGVYEGVFRNKLHFQGKSVPAKCYSIIPSDYA